MVAHERLQKTPTPSTNDDVLRAIACEPTQRPSHAPHPVLGLVGLLVLVAIVVAVSAHFAQRAQSIDPSHELPFAH